MKMYVLVRDDAPPGFDWVAVAHGPLSCYLQYQDDPDMQTWVKTSFRKAVCRVTPEEYERAKQAGKYVVITESSLGGQELALVFAPRSEWPKMFRFLKLCK